MFNAKLFDDSAYCTMCRKLLLMGLPGVILLGYWFGSAQMNLWFFVLVILLMGGMIAWQIRIRKNATNLS